MTSRDRNFGRVMSGTFLVPDLLGIPARRLEQSLLVGGVGAYGSRLHSLCQVGPKYMNASRLCFHRCPDSELGLFTTTKGVFASIAKPAL